MVNEIVTDPRDSFDNSRYGCGFIGGGSASSSTGKNVVVAMDALKPFSTKPLEWALENVVEPGTMVTLLGVTPWLNYLLQCKTWLDIWTLDLGGIINNEEKKEWKNYPRHQRLRNIVELCEARGVMLLMKVVQGHPVKLTVLEQTTNLRATWIVFDSHQKRRREYYKKKIPCNMVMMKDSGEIEVLNVISSTQDTSEIRRSSMSSTFFNATPPTELITSNEWVEFLDSEREKWEAIKSKKHLSN